MDYVWGLLYGLVLSVGMVIVMRCWAFNGLQRRGAWAGIIASVLLYAMLVASFFTDFGGLI